MTKVSHNTGHPVRVLFQTVVGLSLIMADQAAAAAEHKKSHMRLAANTAIPAKAVEKMAESPEVAAQAEGGAATIKAEAPQTWQQKMSEKFGLNYFVFFDGPGLTNQTSDMTPGVLGQPLDDGLSLFNLVSFKWKFSKSIGLDLQTRTQIIVNRADESRKPLDQFRWQSPRLGISGTLLKGEDWALSGAVNTDLPYSFPQPLGGGNLATQRTVLLTPGMFANFSYTPVNSRFSLFTLLTPRYFLYEDPNAAEPNLKDPAVSRGLTAQHKPEFILSLTPTLNYRLNEKSGLRVGTTLDYRKLVLSESNPFDASLSTRDTSPSWRLWATPLTFGYTHDFSRLLNVYAYVQTFPIEEQRRRANGSVARLEEVSSVGMWFSGTVF